jgi:hypothetical protein
VLINALARKMSGFMIFPNEPGPASGLMVSVEKLVHPVGPGCIYFY